jgi:hypothetical protein
VRDYNLTWHCVGPSTVTIWCKCQAQHQMFCMIGMLARSNRPGSQAFRH